MFAQIGELLRCSSSSPRFARERRIASEDFHGLRRGQFRQEVRRTISIVPNKRTTRSSEPGTKNIAILDIILWI